MKKKLMGCMAVIFICLCVFQGACSEQVTGVWRKDEKVFEQMAMDALQNAPQNEYAIYAVLEWQHTDTLFIFLEDGSARAEARVHAEWSRNNRVFTVKMKNDQGLSWKSQKAYQLKNNELLLDGVRYIKAEGTGEGIYGEWKSVEEDEIFTDRLFIHEDQTLEFRSSRAFSYRLEDENKLVFLMDGAEMMFDYAFMGNELILRPEANAEGMIMPLEEEWRLARWE